VAGTIGAGGNNTLGVVGVNWQVSLLALRAGRADGGLRVSDLADAIAYACAKRARVVNGSFGGSGQSLTLLGVLGLPACSNTLFVFAAGNGGTDGVGDNNDLAPQYPCDYALSRIVCVAATGRTDAKTPFSNFGLTSVDLAAPGVDILSTWPGSRYLRADGTSMASPHVAGVAALVLARFPSLTAEELRNKVLNGVDTVPGLVGIVATGGRVNALRALSAPTTPPVAPPLSPPASPTPPPPAAPTASAPRDTAAPNTRLASGPARATRAKNARFSFGATEAGSRFECRLDRGRWIACRSPKSYRKLRAGAHTFRVRAIDATGNVDATPARRTWRIR
jgi:subtilisin family serine protease